MKRLYTTIIFIIASLTIATAQTAAEKFQITLPEGKVAGSLYRTIHFIDSRYDTTNMGIVQLGAFNRKARVIPQPHFSHQLQEVLNTLNDQDAKDGELLFQLWQFNFAEVTGAMSEKGYGYLRATLYGKNKNNYTKIATIDTVLYIKTMDVTRALFRKGSSAITDFLRKNIIHDQPLDGAVYTYDQVLKMDSIEKQTMKLYTSQQFTDGLYRSYESFRDQVPDNQHIEVAFRNEQVSSVKAKNQNGDLLKIDRDDVYAFVHNGRAYVATEFGFYPLERRADDLYFTGKTKVNANAGDVIVASVFFGIIGGLIASGSGTAEFEMKIDHVSGGFIRLREVK